MSGREIRGDGTLLLCVVTALLLSGVARHFVARAQGPGGPPSRAAASVGTGPPVRTIVVPAGFRLEQVADLVGAAFGTSGGHFLALVDNPEQARLLGIVAPTLEGYLAPGTYQVPLGVSEDGSLAEMVGRFESQLTPTMRSRARQLGLSLSQVVTLASIVQREAQFASDMPPIAGVFLNRLRAGMPLQSDPTVQYAIDSAEGASDPSRYWIVRLQSQDLKVASPYNTYLHKGLPPGPIDSPSTDAIKAVLYPPRVGYLYFLGKPNGATVFAKTLAEHRKNVELYYGGGAPARPRSVLEGLIDRVAQTIKGHVGIVVENLATGETASLNAGDFFTSASLYKLFVLDAAFERRKQRKLSFNRGLPISPAAAALDRPAVRARLGREPTVTQALLNMIVVSSNAAGVTLLDKLGAASVNRFVHRQGLRDTFLTRARFVTTPRDVAHLLELIATGRAVGPKASRQMRTMLLRQEINGGLPRFLPRGTPLAHKTGTLQHANHDAGIIYTRVGPIVIVAMTEGEPDPTIVTKTIARLAQFVVDYFELYRPAAARIAATGNPACPDNPFRPSAGGPLAGKTIVLDPGHGGAQNGAIVTAPGGRSLTEKEVNHDIALTLKDQLTARGATVYMTRCRDVRVSFFERAAYANSVRADLFLSIHLNASPNAAKDGTEVYYLSRQGHALANYLLGSFTLPALWQTLSARLALPNGGVHRRPFDVLVYAQAPGALTESLFMSDPAEAAALLATGPASRREQVARGHVRGIVNYFTARTSAAPGAAKRHRPIARPQPEVEITATGDIVMGRAPLLPSDGGASLFSEVEPSLLGDVVLGNLEATLTTGGRSKCAARKRQCFAFRVPPSYARWLKHAGFTVLNLANNHAYDFGARGQVETLAALRRAGLGDTGRPGEIALQRVGSIVVATVGFAPYPWAQNLLDLKAARRLVRQAAAEADLVIVAMHAGGEGNRYLHVRPGPERFLGERRGDPVAFAHAVVDAGADLVVGSGPHVLRGMEWYHGRLIAYSLGNLVGYRSLSLKGWQKVSAILRVTLRSDGSWAGGRLTAVRLVKPGIPILDSSGAAYWLVRTLSRQDFGTRGLRISSTGVLTPPRRR